MEIKKNGNNINIYDEEKLTLHIDRRDDIFPPGPCIKTRFFL